MCDFSLILILIRYANKNKSFYFPGRKTHANSIKRQKELGAPKN